MSFVLPADTPYRGSIFLALVENHTQIVIGIGELVIRTDGALEGLPRLFIVLHHQIGDADLVQKPRVIWFLVQRCLVIIESIEIHFVFAQQIGLVLRVGRRLHSPDGGSMARTSGGAILHLLRVRNLS